MLLVRYPSSSIPTRAAAILLGHLGATTAQMEEYSSLFVEKGCITIATASPPLRFVMNRSLNDTCLDALRATLEAIHQFEQNNWKNSVTGTKNEELDKCYDSKSLLSEAPLPILVHSMSNGGAFLLEEMERTLLHDLKKQISNERVETSSNSLSQVEKAFLLDRMRDGCQIFDSCPCYIRTVWNQQHPDTSVPQFDKAFPHPQWSSGFRKLFTYAATASLSTWCAVTLATHRPEMFWNHMLASTVCNYQTYLYTATDIATDANALDDLIAYRRHRHGNQPTTNDTTSKTFDKDNDCVQVFKFHDSSHCRLHHDHTEEYNYAIENAIIKSCARMKIRSTQSNQSTLP